MNLRWVASSAIMVIGSSTAAQAASVLTTAWLNSGFNQETICFAINVSQKPHDITVEIIEPYNGNVAASVTCTAVPPIAPGNFSECFAVGVSGFDDVFCRVTVKGPKASVRANLATRNTADEAITAVVPAQ